ncbi:MAG: transketolase [Lawsonibacter sp.]|nr:transketolase [Lawsonibacter sp.]
MIQDPKEFARAVRMRAAETLMRTRDSHIGGGYSSADILAVLYTRILGLTPERLEDPNRNIFLLSKGHIAATFYTTLAYAGLIPMEDLELHVTDGENYAGHTRRFVVPGVEMSAGSLGHGASLGAGIAYGKKLQGLQGRVFVLMGDGECNEGSVWEAAMLAARFSLNNLVLIVDRNGLQSYGSDKQVMNMGDMAEKFRAFGCRTVEVDGHDYAALEEVFSRAGLDGDPRPVAVVAHTVKGKGVSFMEDRLEWHFKSPNEEQLAQALEELKG